MHSCKIDDIVNEYKVTGSFLHLSQLLDTSHVPCNWNSILWEGRVRE
jgi:hypothetical protein